LTALARGAFVVLAVAAAGCRPGSTSSRPDGVDVGASDAGASDGARATPQVMLSWRLFETTHALDANGQDRTTAVLELLANGGTPASVSLGRRAAQGCVVSDGSGERSALADVVASLDCYAYAHGEYARVVRSGPRELRVEAFGQDEAFPDHEPTRTSVTSATVRIPEGAEILVDHEVARVPDETPAK
jgi:hypothetical protein